MNRKADRTGITRTVVYVIVFAVAMGYFESVVVLYLRDIFGIHGSEIPTGANLIRTLRIEVIREAATIVMLIALGWLSGRSATTRIAFFLVAFAIWDLCYYLFLEILLGWPESLFTWDILFLIPLPWTAPVLAPIICSLTMLLLAFLIFNGEQRAAPIRLAHLDTALIVGGAILELGSFLWNAIVEIIHMQPAVASVRFEDGGALAVMAANPPTSFIWPLFASGEAVALFGIFVLGRRVFGGAHRDARSGARSGT